MLDDFFTCATSVKLISFGVVSFIIGFIIWSYWYKYREKEVLTDMKTSPHPLNPYAERKPVAVIADILTSGGMLVFIVGIAWYLVCLFL